MDTTTRLFYGSCYGESRLRHPEPSGYCPSDRSDCSTHRRIDRRREVKVAALALANHEPADEADERTKRRWADHLQEVSHGPSCSVAVAVDVVAAVAERVRRLCVDALAKQVSLALSVVHDAPGDDPSCAHDRRGDHERDQETGEGLPPLSPGCCHVPTSCAISSRTIFTSAGASTTRRTWPSLISPTRTTTSGPISID